MPVSKPQHHTRPHGISAKQIGDELHKELSAMSYTMYARLVALAHLIEGDSGLEPTDADAYRAGLSGILDGLSADARRFAVAFGQVDDEAEEGAR